MENNQPQPIQTPPLSPDTLLSNSQSAPSPKQSHLLRFFFIGLALILFGILVGVLAARFLPISKTPSIFTQTDTTGWEIYTNNNLGFKFMYPSGWSIQENANATNQELLRISLASPETQSKIYNLSEHSPGGPSADVGIVIEPKEVADKLSGSYSIGLVRNNQLNDPEIAAASNVSQIVTNNISFTKANVNADPPYITFVVEHDNKYFALDFGNSTTSLTPTEELILSSFEFTLPLSESARVETCKEESSCVASAGGNVGCANPASKFCTCMGGTLSPQENEKGQYSLCVIDGEKVEEWAYFRSKTSEKTSYSCPASEWVDCMPGPDSQNPQCTNDFLTWAKANCPNFKGAAL